MMDIVSQHEGSCISGFVAGTMVLTESGFREIERLPVGTVVLTHRGRWMPVMRVVHAYASTTRVLRGQGFPDIRTADSHPFLVRDRSHRYNNVTGGQLRVFAESAWLSALHLSGSSFVGQVLPPIDPSLDDHSADFWWIVGRYLADGWRVVANAKGRVLICAAHHEADEVKARINRVFHCTRSPERTAVKFHIPRTGFHQFLDPFGKGAGGKLLPGWVFSLETEKAAALLEGYFTGDGSPVHAKDGTCVKIRATTISRSLALSMALLAQRTAMVVASVHEAQVPEQTVIEGRLVNQHKQYAVVIPHRNRSAFVEGNSGWKLIRSNMVAGPAEVYALSVEEDESYIADGVIVGHG